jgi:hypothetical protein
MISVSLINIHNIMLMSYTPLAYKYVMTVAMIAFVNHYASRLNMAFDVPLKEQEIQRLGVGRPECDEIMTLYGGGIRVKNYSFGFGDSHVNNRKYVGFTSYFTITKLDDDGTGSLGIPPLTPHESSNSLMERASRMKYTVSTNDLYRIATNYLMALDIDQRAIETMNPLKLEQGVFHSNRGLVPSPMMQIYWGKPALREPGSNGIALNISAVSGELLELNAGNTCGCTGLPLIKDLDKLLAISDEEFLKYSDSERSNLVARFVNLPSQMITTVTNLDYWFPQTNRPAVTNVPMKIP